MKYDSRIIYRGLEVGKSQGTCVVGEIPEPMCKRVGGGSEISEGVPSFK